MGFKKGSDANTSIETGLQCVSITEPSLNDKLPSLEKEDRCKDIDTATNKFKINEAVQVYCEDLLQNAQILDLQQKNGNTLYLIHYNALSSVHDEWVPAHKILTIQTNKSPSPN